MIKQQWLIIQQNNRHDHPRDTAIISIIKAINIKRTEGRDIVICMDGDESFTSDKGGISKICKECKPYDLLEHRH